MAKVKKYSSLEEKGEVFEQINIETIDQLSEIIEFYKVNENNHYLFRGCKEAHFKLYNKAQREWIKNDLDKRGIIYEGFILNEIKNAKNWQDNLLVKFFSAFGQSPNDLLILGFLQHYGAPTPFLDWTYSFENSLFFATDGLKNSKSTKEIYNYFSIYIIDNVLNKISNHIENVIEDSKWILHNREKSGIDNIDRLQNHDFLYFLSKLSYHNLKNEVISLVPGYLKNGIEHEISEYSFKLFYNQQNLNIINQQGFFIFNASQNDPLEYYFKGVPVHHFIQKVNYNKIKCYNIHKSLLEHVQMYLNANRTIPINKEFIYPQEEIIARKVYQQFLNFDNLNNE